MLEVDGWKGDVGCTYANQADVIRWRNVKIEWYIITVFCEGLLGNVEYGV
jgi:hypothetical protein